MRRSPTPPHRSPRPALLLLLAWLVAACVRATPPSAIPTSTASPTLAPPPSPSPTASLSTDWWNDAIFYEVFVRSFYDSNGDGIGDFKGLLERLDYLNDGNPSTTTDLGVTGLWLMPIFPSSSYHGYDVIDYYSVNPQYGTLDDFKRLLDEAHRRGIHVIIDMVMNHTSVEHPWFQASQDPESPYRNWYIWAEADPGGTGPWGEKTWHPSPSGRGYFYGIFGEGMPDLNYTEPAVTAEMQRVARFWLEEVGVDGFRLDAARYIIEQNENLADTQATHRWLREFRAFCKSLAPHALIVGEVWTTNFTVASYIKGEDLDLVFDFDLASALLKGVNSGQARIVRDAMKMSQRLLPPGRSATFLTNHDMPRVMTALAQDEDKARLAATLLLTMPGVPFIYYGEEIGMSGGKPDERIRTPMQWSAAAQAGFTTGTPWEAVNSGYSETNVAGEAVDPRSLLSHYRTLIALRHQHAALRAGDLALVEVDNPAILAFLRFTREETLLVIVNLSKTVEREYRLSLSEGPLSGSYLAMPLLGEGEVAPPQINAQGGFEAYQPLPALPASGTLIIQLRPEK
ncbi:MAG: alpha-amylase family glycosyl hydrolase [Anaerolineales bacterium]